MAKKKKDNLSYLKGSVPSNFTPTQIKQAYLNQNLFEFIVDRGGRVGKSLGISNGTSTLYTVPLGKVAYLMSCNISWLTGTTAQQIRMKINEDVIIQEDSSPTVGSHENTSLSFPIPIRLNENETIKIQTSTGTTVNAAILVYEVDKFLDTQFRNRNF